LTNLTSGKKPKRGRRKNMARPRAADDVAAIRARMEQLRRERETIPPDDDGTDKAGMALVMCRMLERVPT
jgi:hypothetical protein